MSIDVNATQQPITASASGDSVSVSVGETTVSASASGGIGPVGPTGPQGPPGTTDYLELQNVPSEFNPSAHAATHGATGSDPVTLAVSQINGLGDALDGKLPLAGGAMNTSAVVTFNDGTNDSEIGAWGFGVETTGGSNYATVTATGIIVHSETGSTTILPSNVAFANGTSLTVGSWDNGTNGAKGVSLICAVGYELNWQGGRLRNMAVGGDGTALPLVLDSALVLPADGVTFNDATQQTTAWTGVVNTANIASGAVTSQKLDANLSTGSLTLTSLMTVQGNGGIGNAIEVHVGGFFNLNVFVVNKSGHVTAGQWKADPIPVNHGGTGATTASGARTNLGLGTLATQSTVAWSTDITGKPSTFTPSSHSHLAADISDFSAAVVAAAPPTTNASLLTSGTLSDARLSANIARTSDVTSAVAAVVGAAPASLDTLQELAAALSNDASFASTVTASLAAKAPLASPTFTGTVSGITAAMVGLGNVNNTSDANKPVSTATQTALDGKVGTSDSRLTDAREWSASTVTQSDAEAGTATTRAAWTVQRVWQAIAAWWAASSAKTKLDGIASGATANQTDAYLLSRANHTGSQSASTITGLAAVATSGAYSDLSGTPSAYSLPVATSSTLGGVKQGANVTIDGSGVISVAAPVTSLAWTAITGKPTFATVATSGAYSDLSGTPSLAAIATSGSASDLTTGTVAIARIPTGSTSSTVCIGNDARLSDARTPTSHVHGNITNAGAIGSTSGLPIITTTSGVLTAGAFGTTTGTFCQGNDSRLSDSRTPTTHASTHQTGGSDAVVPVVSSPSSIGANTNDYAIGTGDIFRITSSAAYNITGIVAGTSGQTIVLINIGSNAITLTHQDTSSTAANRIIVPWAGNYIIAADSAAVLIYDSTTARWRVV